jgi:hypothetical protein
MAIFQRHNDRLVATALLCLVDLDSFRKYLIINDVSVKDFCLWSEHSQRCMVIQFLYDMFPFDSVNPLETLSSTAGDDKGSTLVLSPSSIDQH